MVAFTCIVYVCVLLYVGSMDEVNQEVNITWVQPRVLGLNQVCVLSLFFMISRNIIRLHAYRKLHMQSRALGHYFVVKQCLASYPGSWWAERERAWYPLLAHARNYLLLNTCSDKSGRGTRNTYPRDW